VGLRCSVPPVSQFVVVAAEGQLTQSASGKGCGIVALGDDGQPRGAEFEPSRRGEDPWREDGPDEPRLRRRARLQGLALMTLSAAITILAFYGTWALVRS
jgi:hypothetical protein